MPIFKTEYGSVSSGFEKRIVLGQPNNAQQFCFDITEKSPRLLQRITP